MNYSSFVLLAGGAHYAFPDAFTFLLAVLAGAAASRKTGRLLWALAFGLAIGVASWILILYDFRPGGARVDAELFVQCVIGALGGFLGATVVKARKKRKNGDSSGEESAEKSILTAGKES